MKLTRVERLWRGSLALALAKAKGQSGLARKLKVTRACVSNWVCRRRSPSFSEFVNVSRYVER